MASKKDTTSNIGRDAKTGRFIALKETKRGKSTTTVATTKKKK